MLLYQTHWWRCNGVCQTRRPHFGIVRRSSNRAPGPKDFWWEDHARRCGGTFVKIKEPKGQKFTKSTKKPNADITKYVTTNNKTNNNNITKPVLKDSNSATVKTKPKSINTLIIPKREPVFNPQSKKSPVFFEGKGENLIVEQRKTNEPNVVEQVRNVWSKKQSDVPCTPDKKDQVAETVRNVWAKKQLPVALTLDDVNKGKNLINKKINVINRKPSYMPNPISIHASNCIYKSPPPKMKKISDYFEATSVLKDLYGDNIMVTESTGDTQKLIAVSNTSKSPGTIENAANNKNAVDDKNDLDLFDSVKCPICNASVKIRKINRHLDECLNKEFIESICNETSEEVAGGQSLLSAGQTNKPFRIYEEKVVSDRPSIPARNEFKPEIARPDAANTTNLDDVENEFQKPFIKNEPGASRGNVISQCACCGKTIDNPPEEHLDECLAFFGNNTTIPEEGASTNTTIELIVIDDDEDMFDESLTLNATGTKVPCPCCLEMVEEAEMNEHLDMCLS